MEITKLVEQTDKIVCPPEPSASFMKMISNLLARKYNATVAVRSECWTYRYSSEDFRDHTVYDIFLSNAPKRTKFSWEEFCKVAVELLDGDPNASTILRRRRSDESH